MQLGYFLEIKIVHKYFNIYCVAGHFARMLPKCESIIRLTRVLMLNSIYLGDNRQAPTACHLKYYSCATG